MTFQLNVAAIAVAGQAAWKRAKPIVVQDVVLLPLAGFGIILLWWVVALGNHGDAHHLEAGC